MRLLIAAGIAVLILLAGCSSATYNQRFEDEDNPRERTSTKEDEQQTRFNDLPDADLPAESFLSKYNEIKKIEDILTPREKILLEVMRFLNIPYLYGGNDYNGMDCSAFTENVFKNSLGIVIPRTAREQFEVGTTVFSKDNLMFGDLVFFDTSRQYYPGHVGIYLGDDKFVHAGLSSGVTISSLDESYFSEKYISGKRLDFININH